MRGGDVEEEAVVGRVSVEIRRVGVACAYAEGIEGTGGFVGESYDEKRTEVGVFGILKVLGGREVEATEEAE